MKFHHKCTGDRLAVDVTPEDTTTGGIIIPRGNASEEQIGEILAVGQMKDNRIIPGIKVLFMRHAGTQYPEHPKQGERTVKIIREEDILLLMQPEIPELKSVGNH